MKLWRVSYKGRLTSTRNGAACGAKWTVFGTYPSLTFALFESVQRHKSWEMGAFMVK